jgi:hypothetical protein
MRLVNIYLGYALLCVLLGTAARRAPDARSGLGLRVGHALLLGLAALFMLWASQPQEWLSDFNKAYYPAGQMILERPGELYNTFGVEFVNVPGVALLFVPLAHLSQAMAGLVFTAVCLGALAAAWLLLARLSGASGWRRAALLALFVLNGPISYSIREGNLTHAVLLLAVGALFALVRGRDILAGVCLALAAIIKLPLLLLVVGYAGRGRWRVTLGAGLAFAAFAALSLGLLGLPLHHDWMERCITPYTGGVVTAYNVQSILAALARLEPGANLSSWFPMPATTAIRLANSALTILVAGLTGWALLRRKAAPGQSVDAEKECRDFCAVLCLALVISPLSWTHYYLLLLVPLSLWIGGLFTLPGRGRTACLLLATLLLSLPVVDLTSSRPLRKLLASHYLFGALLLQGALLVPGAQRRRAEPVLEAVPLRRAS